MKKYLRLSAIAGGVGSAAISLVIGYYLHLPNIVESRCKDLNLMEYVDSHWQFKDSVMITREELEYIKTGTFK